MKQSRNVRTKIFVGYALIVTVCAACIGYVYREMSRIGAPDTYQAQLQIRRKAVNQTLYHLYQAESYGQLMLAGYRSYADRYRRELGTVRLYLDSLRAMAGETADSLQTLRLDSISLLLNEKERSTMNLRRDIRSASAPQLLERNIEALIARTDTLAPIQGITRPRVAHDTVRTPRRKRPFFRRIADVFSPPKEDSSVMISTRIVLDTVRTPLSDTIAGVLRNLQEEVTSERVRIFDRASSEGRNLRYSNHLVNEQIYRLMTDFEQEETHYLLARIDAQTRMKERSTLILGGIAIAALLLMLLFVAILWRDISRSNRYKRQLEQANRYNEELLAVREKLMLTITHDIKAPLSSVMGYIDLLTRLTEERRQRLYLDHMKSASLHLLSLVNNLLDFYRLESNKVEVNSVAFTPSQLFASILDGFAPLAAEKGIELRAQPGKGAQRQVCGDAFRIRQIADNLISNALKFTDRGSICVGVECEGARLVFYVRDTGRGIGREERERIFREFVRLSSAQGVAGFGLGLSIVDRLVKLLGGRIWVESSPGNGSRFTVSLPVRDQSGEQPPCSLAAKQSRPVRCLLVDDDAFQLEMTEAMCAQLGIEAACCQYPEYAARLVREERYDLVLTDIQMPSMNGFEVLRAIREAAPDLPVVAVSARSDEGEESYTSDGFAALLPKPFSPSELCRVVAQATGIGLAAPLQREAAQRNEGPDFGALTRYARDDEQAAARILRSFADESRRNALLLAGAAEQGDADALRAVAHKMVPIFKLIGCTQLAAELHALERHEGPVDEPLVARARQAAQQAELAARAAEQTITEEKR